MDKREQTTIRLPEKLLEQLKQEADRRRKQLKEVLLVRYIKLLVLLNPPTRWDGKQKRKIGRFRKKIHLYVRSKAPNTIFVEHDEESNN